MAYSELQMFTSQSPVKEVHSGGRGVTSKAAAAAAAAAAADEPEDDADEEKLTMTEQYKRYRLYISATEKQVCALLNVDNRVAHTRP
jgi:hypothetical protein